VLGSTYISNRFFYALCVVIALFVLWFAFPVFEYIAKGSFVLLFITVLVEWILLYNQRARLTVERKVTDRLSLSDVQPINYKISSAATLRLDYEMIDEMPFQLQERSLSYSNVIEGGEVAHYKFDIRPVIRGAYQFGDIHLYISLPYPGLCQRRITTEATKTIEVYPSFMQMKYYDLQVFSKSATLAGIRQVRRLGTNDEFEHIKSYTQGDTPRSINWRATSRSNEVMVNQYQDTRSQNVYCVVDMGRSMKMPFDNLSLLDYAINSSLVLSNIILKKYDRVGLITFAEDVKTVVKADTNRHQLQKIITQLYNQDTSFKEASYERLYYRMRHQESRRSILLLFSNFEHLDDFKSTSSFGGDILY